MKRIACTLTAAAMLAACSSQIQTTSGADYLARYQTASGGAPLDPRIQAAASVEPIITFPARFGLARIQNGQLTAIPPAEAELWLALAERHAALGEFVAVSPLVAAFADPEASPPRNWWEAQDIGRLVRTIRQGAARQHVDVVLIYTAGADTHRDFTPLSILDITLVGGVLLPTRSIKAEGVASALLLDVRNGYPYGTANATSDLARLSNTYGSASRTREAGNEAALQAVANLVPEVEKMIGDLVAETVKQTASRPAK